MKRKTIIISASAIALIGASIASYALFYTTNYNKAVDTCISRNLEDYDGIANDYKEYCECFIQAPQKVLSKEAYNEWLEIYTKDKYAAKNFALENKDILQPQHECMMDKAPVEIWLELIFKIYRNVEGFSEEETKCIIENIVNVYKGQENFINFVKMKLLDKSGKEFLYFKKIEESLKSKCVE